MSELYISWHDAARSSSLSEATLRRMVKSGHLTAPQKLGPGRVAFDREGFERDLRAFVARQNGRAAA